VLCYYVFVNIDDDEQNASRWGEGNAT